MGFPWFKRAAPASYKIDPDKRFDSWQNTMTGLGTNRDKVYQGSYWAPIRIQDTELLAMYNGNDIAATICETGPKEMMRRGYELTVPDDGGVEVDPDDLKELTKYGAKLRADDLVIDAGVWGNVFGGSIIILGAEDGNDPSEPLNEKRIRTVRYLNIVDRRFIFVHKYYNDPLSPNYGLPEQYLVTNGVGGSNPAPGTVVVHETRCIRFDGARTDILTRQQLAGWTWSVLQRPYDILRAFDMGYQACANLMSDASQGVMKIQGLINMIASNEKDALQSRMALVDMSRSVARILMVDAEMEEFERTPTSFEGLSDLLDRFMMRLSAATSPKIPVSILMGRSAQGMNATGDSDFRAYYDELSTLQENQLAPKLERLYHVLACAQDGPFGGDVEFNMKFHPLWQPSDEEQAKVEYMTAQKDQIYLTTGVLTPEEVALSRYGKGRFSTETKIDVEAAKRRAQDENMFGNMVNPPPELQGQGAEGQGEQQTGVTALPGPSTNSGSAGTTGGSGYTLGGAAYVGKDQDR